MKKTAIAIAMMTLILIGTAVAQPGRRKAGSTAMGGGSGVGLKNRQPMNMRKRIDKATPVANLGDTATHEVGHNGNRRNGQFRPNPTGDGTTQQFRKTNANGQNNRSRHSQNAHYDPIKFDGVDGVVSTTQPKNITLTAEEYKQERTKHPRRNRQIRVPALDGRDKEFVKPSNPKQ